METTLLSFMFMWWENLFVSVQVEISLNCANCESRYPKCVLIGRNSDQFCCQVYSCSICKRQSQVISSLGPFFCPFYTTEPLRFTLVTQSKFFLHPNLKINSMLRFFIPGGEEISQWAKFSRVLFPVCYEQYSSGAHRLSLHYDKYSLEHATYQRCGRYGYSSVGIWNNAGDIWIGIQLYGKVSWNKTQVTVRLWWSA